MPTFRSRQAASVACVALMLSVAGCGSNAREPAPAPAPDNAQHVLLLSVDGMHQSDLAGYIRTRPDSPLAMLVGRGISYTNAQTPVPSDSFPGLLAQVTGGHPRTTGVYYDDSYAHDLLEPGTTNCAGAKPGGTVSFTGLDKDLTKIDGGQGLTNLPGGVLQMTGTPTEVIDSAKLPVDPPTMQAT